MIRGPGIIAPDAIVYEKEIAKGGMGVVWKGRWQGTEVAIKKLLVVDDTYQKKVFKKETSIMAHLSHPNIVAFYGRVKKTYDFVLEWVEQGSLFGMIMDKRTNAWTLATRYKVCADMARGIEYLHNEGVHHRDVKSLNVLVDSTPTAKISDFGLAKTRKRMRQLNTIGAGTPLWMAPEVRNTRKYGLPSDIFALGKMVWEVFEEKCPTKKCKGEEFSNPIIGAELKALIQKCWRDSASRPTAKTVREELEALGKKAPNPKPPGSPVLKKAPQAAAVRVPERDQRNVIPRAPQVKNDARVLVKRPQAAAVRATLQDAERYFKDAQQCVASGNFPKAISDYQKALGIRINLVGENDSIVSTYYYNIGCIYYNQGDFHDALANFQKSLNIECRLHREAHADVITCYLIVGEAHYQLKNFHEALVDYQKALDISINLVGEDDSMVSACYYNLGCAYYELGEFQNALANYQKSLDIERRLHREAHDGVGLYTFKVGEAHYQLANFLEATIYYANARVIYWKLYGENDPNVAHCTEKVENSKYQLKQHGYKLQDAEVYFEMAQKCDTPGDKVVGYYKKALDIRIKFVGENDSMVSKCYYNLGVTYYDHGDFHDALANFQKSLNIERSLHGEAHADVGLCYRMVGKAHFQLANFPEAIVRYQKTVDIMINLVGLNDSTVGYGYFMIGEAHFQLAKLIEAKVFYGKAMNIYRDLYGENDPSVASCKEKIENCSLYA